MGLFFNKKPAKREIKRNLIPMQIMIIGAEQLGGLKMFNDLDDNYSMIVDYAYFYAVFQLELISLAGYEEAQTILSEAIKLFEEAMAGKNYIENFNYTFEKLYNNAFQNIQKATNNNDILDVFAQDYLNDLYSKEIKDDVKLEVAKLNIKEIIRVVKVYTTNAKIVK